MPKKQQRPERKQRRDNLSRVPKLAAALYWGVKLIRELWDWYND